MANKFQHKRGTTARRLLYTPADGELIYDKDMNTIFVGDGSTVGGVGLEAEDKTKIAKGEFGLGLSDGENTSSLNATTINDPAVWHSGIYRYIDPLLPGQYGHMLRLGGGSAGVNNGWFNDIAFSALGGVASRYRANTTAWSGWITHITSLNISSQAVASAAKLTTARTINGVAFDGTANITVVDSTKAPLASPALTGVPTAPTAATTTNTAQLATTAFVQAVNSADTGSSSTALTLKTARTFTYTGDVTGSVSFNGSANVSTEMTLANSGVTAGTYKSVTVDVKGRVTAGADVVTSLVTSTSAAGTTNVATTNTNTYLNIVEKVGASNSSAGTSTQVTGTGTVTVSSDAAGKLTITGAQSITGNAATATKLATARTINGVAFDGSSNITIGEGNSLFLGAVQWFNGNRASIPDGWLAADGQLVSRTTFSALWAIVGTTYPSISDATWLATANSRGLYSTGDGTSTFRLPDLNGAQTNSLQGLFVRGDGNGSIAGVATTIGSVQGDAIRNITGNAAMADDNAYPNSASSNAIGGAFYYTGQNFGSDAGGQAVQPIIGFDASRVVPTASENRPVSAVGVWIIRASGNTSPAPPSGSPATLLANTFNGSQKIVGNLEVTGNLDISGTLAFAKGFENSLNETGWQKLPGGLILQWGYVAKAASGTMPVVFPIVFPQACLGVYSQLRFTSQNYQSTTVNLLSPSGFTLYWDNGATGFYWFAIGK